MKHYSTQLPVKTLVVCLLITIFVGSLILVFGCAPTAQQTAPQISPEREKAIKDSLNKAYIFQLSKHWSTAWEYYKNKTYRSAVKPFWKVIELDTIQRFKNVYSLLSDSYVQLNNPDSAQIVLEMGIKEYPDNAHLHRTLAYYLAGRGLDDEAIEEYETTVEIDSTKVNDWKALGNLYIKNDRIDDAIRAYEIIVDMDPQDHESQQTLSSLYRSTGNEDAAIDRMEEVKKLDPNNTENLYALGRAYFKNNKYNDAIANFELLLKIKPEDTAALEYFGSSQQNNGDFNGAIATYQKILKIQPDNKKVMTDIATCYKELGRYQTARSYVDRALRVDPKYGMARIVRGEIYEATAEYCMSKRGKQLPVFDDKLVFDLAYKEYQKATQDLQFKDLATQKMNYVKDFTPTKEDLFFHKGQTKPEDECYSWIY